jgi:hypothetical protein
MSIVSIVHSDVTIEYPSQDLISLTDDSNTGSIVTAVITRNITRATSLLESLLNPEYGLDSDYYGSDRLKKWLVDLTYYYLNKRVEKEIVARDKLEMVKEEIITYTTNKLPYVVETLTSSDPIMSSEDDYLLKFSDIKDWQ